MAGQSFHPQRRDFRLNEREYIVREFGLYSRAVFRYPLDGHFLFDVGYKVNVGGLGYAHIGVVRHSFKRYHLTGQAFERRLYRRAAHVVRFGYVYARLYVRRATL